MIRPGSSVVVAMLCLAALTACITSAPSGTPTPSDATSPSPTVTRTASPTPSASATSSPTVTPPPSADPIPQRVEGLTAETGGGSGEVLLRWTQNPEDDVVYYIVLRADTPGGARTRIGTVTPEQVTEFEFAPFVDSEATVGYYRVRAVDAAGQEGPKSTEVCGASPGHAC